MAKTRELLEEGFRRLFKHHGPRHWWPGDTPFEVMVGAILTQNTNWGNVEKAIANIKSRGLLSARKLLKLHPAELASLIRPAGYFRVKAKRLRSFLKYFVDNYSASDEKMRERRTSDLRDELLSVNGIGPETADSILLYALEKPVFVIDAYTKRILARHSVCEEGATYEELQELFMGSLEEDVDKFNEYHALIVETGKGFCKKSPRCDGCPLSGWNGVACFEGGALSPGI